MTDPARADNVILMGMKHCGKTSVGRRLADRLGKPFADLDEVILSGRGGGADAIEALFKREGPGEFFRLEFDAFRGLCGRALPNGLVLALGGRTPFNPHLADSLEQCGVLIYINTPFDVIFRRIMAKGTSALIRESDPEVHLRKLYDERHPVYLRRARIVVDGTGEIDGIVARIMSAW